MQHNIKQKGYAYSLRPITLDDAQFIIDIRLEDEYGGFKINVKGTFDKIRTNFFIEITTGDIITPREIKYQYNSIFEDKTINIIKFPNNHPIFIYSY